MSKSKGHTIAVQVGDRLHKITKLMFGRDGSYMVAVPYHKSDSGTLMKMPVTYTRGLGSVSYVPFTDIIDAGSVEEKRIKLTHHRSGFIQFSGDGVLSGRDEKGNPKGIGVQSWPLHNPASGPSFGVTFFGLHDFKLAKPSEEEYIRSEGIVFSSLDFPPVPHTGFVLEGFYYPPSARRFVKKRDDGYSLQIIHPIGFAMDLKVILADENTCEFPGLVGVTVYPTQVSFAGLESGYVLGSSTGNSRRNWKLQKMGDGLYCIYPKNLMIPGVRDLNYS